MIVIFNSVSRNEREQWQRELDEDLKGKNTIPFENEQDIIVRVALDMDTVIDWAEGRVWCNQQEKSCVYAKLQDGNWSTCLLIDFFDFKAIFEKSRTVAIESFTNFRL